MIFLLFEHQSYDFRPMKNSILALLFLAQALQTAAQIINIEELRITGTNDSTRWYGSLKAAANLSKVQQQSLLLHAESRTQYRRDRHIALLLLNSDLLRAGNSDFTNAHFAHLRYNFHMLENFTWEVFSQMQWNRLLLIERRTLGGSGLRYRVFRSKNGKNRLYFGSALMFEENRFLQNFGQREWWRVSNYSTLTLRSPQKALFQTTVYWQPQIGFIKNHRFSTEILLEMPILKHLSCSTDFSFSIDKGLPEIAPLRTYAWRNGLTWRW